MCFENWSVDEELLCDMVGRILNLNGAAAGLVPTLFTRKDLSVLANSPTARWVRIAIRQLGRQRRVLGCTLK